MKDENFFEGRIAISIAETAKACDLCENTVRAEIDRGGFEVTYFGKTPRVTVASILRRLKGEPLRKMRPRETKTAPEPVADITPPRRRGRPRKQPAPEPIPELIPRKRGRPPGSRNKAKELQPAE